jgi:hypothetical protein
VAPTRRFGALKAAFGAKVAEVLTKSRTLPQRLRACLKQAASTLEGLGTHEQKEAVDPTSGYSIIGLVLNWDGHKSVKIAVEADGPYQYVVQGAEDSWLALLGIHTP